MERSTLAKLQPARALEDEEEHLGTEEPMVALVSVFSGMSAVKADGETEGVAVNLPEPDGLGLSGLTQLKPNVGFQQEFSWQTAINSSFQSIKHEQKHPVYTRTELIW